MKDLIDRQAAIDEIIKYVKEKESNGDLTGFIGFTPKGIIEFLKRLPSAKSERKKGKWINGGVQVPWDDMNKNCLLGSAYCSVCGEWLTASDEYACIGNFCPNCGADMRGEQNG